MITTITLYLWAEDYRKDKSEESSTLTFLIFVFCLFTSILTDWGIVTNLLK